MNWLFFRRRGTVVGGSWNLGTLLGSNESASFEATLTTAPIGTLRGFPSGVKVSHTLPPWSDETTAP
ncbi:MAG: hypothetical protein L0G46_02300 [Kocuria sp.]|nr:hypothetical protein [Kocuria sp.]